MRESGFDPSSRFGPFSVDIIHYNPLCLNSPLYRMEEQTAEIMTILGRNAGVSVWRERARVRGERMRALMWDGKDGLFYDYNFQTAKWRRYPFPTTFYPLWAGIATRERAGRVAANLPMFEAVDGWTTSTKHSGDQWDAF